MPRAAKLTKEQIRDADQAVERALKPSQLLKAVVVLLRGRYGKKDKEISALFGWKRQRRVEGIFARFKLKGSAALLGIRGGVRSGRRNLPEDVEKLLLSKLAVGKRVNSREFHDAYCRELGARLKKKAKVARSTTYRILRKHGYRTLRYIAKD